MNSALSLDTRSPAANDGSTPSIPPEQWRSFWSSKTSELSDDGLRAEVGDGWATIRDQRTGKLVEQFTTASTELTIESRLIAVVLDRLEVPA